MRYLDFLYPCREAKMSDFAIIEETIMIDCQKVRLIPFQNHGRLYLLRDHEEYFLIWESEAVEPCRISINSIAAYLPDDKSGTLLISTIEPRNTWLFHFLRDSPEYFISEIYRVIPHLSSEKGEANKNSHSPAPRQLDDVGFNLLNSFSKVTKFYSSTASKLLGISRAERRPRSTSNEGKKILKNPWIVERKYQLPRSNRLATGISPLIWKSFLEHDGKITDFEALTNLVYHAGCNETVRPKIWKLILGLRTPGHSDDDYDAHYEYLQSEFQQIVETLDSMDISEEVRTRIGTPF